MKEDGLKNKALWPAKVLLLLYVLSLPIVRPLNFRFEGLQVPYSDLIFLVAFVAWGGALLSGRARLRSSRLYYFVGAYGIAMTLSAIFSQEPTRSFVKLAAIYYLIAVGLMVFNLVADASFLKMVVFAFLAGAVLTIAGSLAGAIGFYASSDVTTFFLSHYGSLPAGNYPRVKAFFENANMMCNYLNVCFMLALGAGVMGWIHRGVALVLAVLILGSGVLTLSAGVGGIVLSTGLWLWLRHREDNRVLGLTALIAAVMVSTLFLASTLLSPDTGNTDIQTRIPGTNSDVEIAVRPLIWRDAFIRGLEHPILGKGVGTDAADIFYVTVAGQQQWLRDAHNAWLNVFGQAGVIGLVAFIGLCWYLWRICRFKSGFPMHQALSAAFVGAFLFQNLFGSFEDARHLWVLIGLLAATAAEMHSETIREDDTGRA